MYPVPFSGPLFWALGWQEDHPRVRVAQIVMDYMAYGWSPDERCRQHPHLALAEAHAAMGY
jgi:Protein of unknown function (DUF433)